MKKLVFALLLALPLTLSAQIIKRPISTEYPYPDAFKTAQAAPEIPFDMPNADYFVLPGDMNFGEISATATNSKGHVFILSRSNAKGDLHGGSATQLFEFDEKGKYVRELGRDIYSFGYGHGVRVDKNDDIWVADKGTDMVTKFSNKTGKVVMVLGRREELTSKYWQQQSAGRGGGAAGPGGPAGPAARGPEEGGFDEPTDIAWDSKGNIYISDGYGNSRIAKFDKNGNWIGTWGKRGFGPGEFNTVHNVVVDKNDHVWVADRSNGRLQVFDTEGKTPPMQPIMGHQYPPTMDAKPGSNLAYRPGTPDALCIAQDNPDVMFIGDLYPGRVYKLNLDGKVLGYWGGVGKEWGKTGAIHGIACPTENLVYTAEFENWRVQKWVLHPERANTTASATKSSAPATK
jgi:DNA-binding beta-propeller fold protein YncE